MFVFIFIFLILILILMVYYLVSFCLFSGSGDMHFSAHPFLSLMERSLSKKVGLLMGAFTASGFFLWLYMCVEVVPGVFILFSLSRQSAQRTHRTR